MADKNKKQLNRKLKARDGHRAFINEHIQTATELLTDPEPAKIKLESIRITLENKLARLEVINEEILTVLSEDKIEEDVIQSDVFAAKTRECIVEISSSLSKLNEQGASAAHSVISEQNENHSGKKVRLPKIQLKKFSGNPIEWSSFWDAFSSAVHLNSDLNDIDKFNYLRTLLENTAYETIHGLSLTDANYEKAIKLLTDRFGSKDLIVSSHMESLWKLQPVSSMSEIKKLRTMYDKLQSNIHSLQSVGINPETYGQFLYPLVLSKLPEELRILISRKSTDGDLELDNLLQVFKEELQIRERCCVAKMKEDKPSQLSTGARSRQPYTASTLISSGSQSNDRYRGPWCSFCKNGHASAQCTIVTDIKTRKQILRNKGKCFSCLKTGHVSKMCPSGTKCYRCYKDHHVAVCDAGLTRQPAVNPNVNTQAQKATSSTQTATQTTSNVAKAESSLLYTREGSDCVLLQTASAAVCRPDDISMDINIRLVFDSCSQKTYISSELREKLQLPVIGSETLLIKTFGESSAKLQKLDIVQICVKTLEGTNIYVHAYVVPLICSPICDQRIKLACESYPHLRGLKLADESLEQEDLKVHLLIGADYYWFFMEGPVVRGEDPRGPVAIPSKLGYVLSGPVRVETDGQQTTVNLNVSGTHVLKVESSEVCLSEELSKFWSYESVGINPNEKPVQEKFLEELKFCTEENRYEVKLPFKPDHKLLPDNFVLAKHRLENLLKRLKRPENKEILDQYDLVFKQQLDDGVIEEVNDSQCTDIGSIHYLPHREVLRPDRQTTKIRVVLDGSAKQSEKTGNPSLNEVLYAGPSLTEQLFDVLIRFRAYNIALIGDLQKAFLSISIAPEHRNFLRFLWCKNINSDNPILTILRYCRVIFGLNASPFLLAGTLRQHITQYFEEDDAIITRILSSLYVDDLNSGSDSSDSCFELYLLLKECFKSGGFVMRKWLTNCPKLMQKIEEVEQQDTTIEVKSNQVVVEDDQTFTKSSLNTSDSTRSTESIPKVLGLGWNNSSDTLHIDFENVFKDLDMTTVTKRIILSTTAKLYDPLGLVSPVVVLLKVIFQKLCKDDLGWDDPPDEETLKLWSEIIDDLKAVGEISVDRCYLRGISPDQIQFVELHAFGDACKSAYSGVVYSRVVEKSGEISTSLITSKSKVCPISGETIPRLELMSGLILTKLVTNVRNALQGIFPIDRVICWLDSQVALWWIIGINREFKQFVQNRCEEIRRLVPHEHFNYCPTELNPADISCRGMKASDLVKSEVWWNGPAFLRESCESWPKNENFNFIVPEGIDCEIKKNTKITTANLVSEDKASIENLLSVDKFSDVNKLFRITCYILRFVNNIKARIKKSDDLYLQGDLRVSELKKAKTLWYKSVQQIARDDAKFDKVKASLRLFDDEDGVLRCKGRIENAPLPFETVYPVYLPRHHAFTKLIILNAHSMIKHTGLRETLTQLRANFWVVKGRQTVKAIIAKCSICKKAEGKSYDLPDAPPLPKFRVSDNFAFTNIGVDHAGPIYIRNIYGNDKQMYKAWITIFVCSSSRNIHLELATDLSTPSFVRCLTRFKSRRGLPSIVVSDNGKTFTDKGLSSYLLQHNIDWVHITERSPWVGGFYERLIQSIKRTLRKVLRSARLHFEEMETLLIEIEGIINSRPLTYSYDEIGEVLTPSHLCIGRRLLSQSTVATDIDSSSSLSKRAKYLQVVLNHYWDRWRYEYLTSLREFDKGKSVHLRRVPRVGDVVIVHEDKVPRQTWKFGRILKLLPSKDGEVRSAAVKIVSKDGGTFETRRPLRKLYPLEADVEVNRVDTQEGKTETAVSTGEPSITPVFDQDVGQMIR